MWRWAEECGDLCGLGQGPVRDGARGWPGEAWGLARRWEGGLDGPQNPRNPGPGVGGGAGVAPPGPCGQGRWQAPGLVGLGDAMGQCPTGAWAHSLGEGHGPPTLRGRSSPTCTGAGQMGLLRVQGRQRRCWDGPELAPCMSVALLGSVSSSPTRALRYGDVALVPAPALPPRSPRHGFRN